MEWEVLPHIAYSLGIVPSDFHLFWSIQHALEDTCFHNSKDMRKFVENWINSKEESFYRRKIHPFARKMEKLYKTKKNILIKVFVHLI